MKHDINYGLKGSLNLTTNKRWFDEVMKKTKIMGVIDRTTIANEKLIS